MFNWFTRSGKGKFKYDLCDPQWVDLDCVISTISLSITPSNPNVYNLHQHDANLLDDFVKNKVQP